MDYVEGMLYMDYDEGEAINEPCPTCNGTETHFEIAFRFWKCESCSTVWGVGRNKSYFNELQYHETDPETLTED